MVHINRLLQDIKIHKGLIFRQLKVFNFSIEKEQNRQVYEYKGIMIKK